MPIEIRELEIRVAVFAGAHEGAKAAQGGAKGAASGDGTDEIVAECVEQVLRILQTKSRTLMAPSGKHDKMLILAFSDSKKAESGGTAEADDQFEALINPESYTARLQDQLLGGRARSGYERQAAQIRKYRAGRYVVRIPVRQHWHHRR